MSIKLHKINAILKNTLFKSLEDTNKKVSDIGYYNKIIKQFYRTGEISCLMAGKKMLSQYLLVKYT